MSKYICFILVILCNVYNAILLVLLYYVNKK